MAKQIDIAKLTAAERLTLIGELRDSIADDDAPLPPAQHAELLHRLSSFDDDKKRSVSWASVKAELNSRKP